MKGGGSINGGHWTVKVKTLRPGDNIRCDNWGGDHWGGVEVFIVRSVAKKIPKYLDVEVYLRDFPYEGEPTTYRVLLMPVDDLVTMVARDAAPVVKPPKQIKPKTRVVKGEQLKLF